MTGEDHHSEQLVDAGVIRQVDAEKLSRRVADALQPHFAEVSDRVAQAVAETLAKQPNEAPQIVREQPRTDEHAAETQGGESDVEGAGVADTWLDKARGSLVSSLLEGIREEGEDQIKHVVDNAVDQLFSQRAQGRARALADQALQSVLYDSVNSIDEPNERYRFYRENLATLRPIVRDVVNAMYTEDAWETLKGELQGAIPSLLQGDFDAAFSMLVAALSKILDSAEQALSGHSKEILHVFQDVSTTLLQEQAKDSVEDSFDPEQIEQRIHEKAEDARQQLAERIGDFQAGLESLQSEISERTGGSSRRGRQQAAPSGLPPNGFPPFSQPPSGVPPSGMPPSGRPPSGLPPSGKPPSGLPPAVERARHAQQARRKQRSSR